MCKLAYVSNLKNVTTENKKKLFSQVQKLITQSEREGYGIASKSVKGTIEQYRSLDIKRSPLLEQIAPSFCEVSASGSINIDTANEVIFHGRTSTNSVSIPNTHPFNIGNTILCHNGVLSYKGENYHKLTDNDTEDLTYHFDKYGLNNLSDTFTGYAAWIAFKSGTTWIVRDDRAPLFYAYSKQLDCHYFATTQGLIKTMLTNTKAEQCDILTVNDNTAITIDNNEVSSFSSWKGLQSSYYSESKASLSLGTDSRIYTTNDDDMPYLKPHLNIDELGQSLNESDIKDCEDLIMWELQNGVADVYFDGEKLKASEFERLDYDDKIKCSYRSKVG